MFDTESSDPQSSDEKLYSIKHFILFFRWNLIQVNIFQKRNTFPETDVLTYIFLRNWLLFQQIMCVYYVLRAYRQICNFIADLANYIDISYPSDFISIILLLLTGRLLLQQVCRRWTGRGLQSGALRTGELRSTLLQFSLARHTGSLPTAGKRG